jgi:hypothetical protein
MVVLTRKNKSIFAICVKEFTPRRVLSRGCRKSPFYRFLHFGHAKVADTKFAFCKCFGNFFGVTDVPNETKYMAKNLCSALETTRKKV